MLSFKSNTIVHSVMDAKKRIQQDSNLRPRRDLISRNSYMFKGQINFRVQTKNKKSTIPHTAPRNLPRLPRHYTKSRRAPTVRYARSGGPNLWEAATCLKKKKKIAKEKNTHVAIHCHNLRVAITRGLQGPQFGNHLRVAITRGLQDPRFATHPRID
jgi:hypothetical protein